MVGDTKQLAEYSSSGERTRLKMTKTQREKGPSNWQVGNSPCGSIGINGGQEKYMQGPSRVVRMSYSSLGFRLMADGQQGGGHTEGGRRGKVLSTFAWLFDLAAVAQLLYKN